MSCGDYVDAPPFNMTELVYYYPDGVEGAMLRCEDDSKRKNPSNTSTMVLQFWEPWCGPCVSSTPFLNRFSVLYDDIEFFAINGSSEAVETSVCKFAYPSILDTQGSTILQYKTKLNIKGVPNVVLIHEGKVVFCGHPLDHAFEKALMSHSQRQRNTRFPLPASWSTLKQGTKSSEDVLAEGETGCEMPPFDLSKGKHILHFVESNFEDENEVKKILDLPEMLPGGYAHHLLVSEEDDIPSSMSDVLGYLVDADNSFVLDCFDTMKLEPGNEAVFSFAVVDGHIIEAGPTSLVQFTLSHTK